MLLAKVLFPHDENPSSAMMIFLVVGSIWECSKNCRKYCYDSEESYYYARHTIYHLHMVRTEASAEEAYQKRKQEPPRHSTSKETEQNEQTRHNRSYVARAVVRLHTKHSKEGENIWYDGYEICHRKAEHRAEVAPRCCRAGTVASNLWRGVLEEDNHTYNHDEDTSENRNDIFVLLDLRLQESVEEEGDDSHNSIGTSNTQSRHKSRKTILAEGSLNAQHSHRAYRD